MGVFSGGTVTRYDAHGTPVWNRTATSLYQDWKVQPTLWYQPDPYLPNLYEGYNPYGMSTTGTHPYATADFTGDGVADVAVAYAVADYPFRPFTSPGSQLDYGTFVTILDGRTGKTAWSKLIPGYVGNMLVQDGTLVVADSTGPDWTYDPTPEQGDSRSSLTAYRFGRAAGGTLTGTAAWTYSTHAPNAHWGDLQSIGGGRITASWSDTPFGLGTPRPAAGHVLVLDGADGHVAVDTRTPGYPRMLAQDPQTGRVLVVEQNDPFDEVRWDLTSIDPHSGARAVVTSREGTIPEAFRVVPDAHGKEARYAVAELGINADLTDGRSTVSGWDAQGGTTWSYTTASTVGGPNAPVMALDYDTHGNGEVVASVSDPAPDTAALQNGPEHTQLLAFDAADGSVDWKKEGAVSGDQLTAYHGRLLTVGYDETAYLTDPQDGSAQTLPLLGDPYAAVALDVNGDGVKDLVVGGQSRGVFALDGRALKKGTAAILWRATVGGSVHRLQEGRFADRHGRPADSLVAATGTGFAVLDARTGAVRSQVAVHGSYVGAVTVTGDGHGGSQIVVPGSTLTAYTADGDVNWTYRPAGTKGKALVFSTAATDGAGHLLLEYGGAYPATGTATVSDPAPTAVSLDAATGTPVWTRATDDSGSAAWVAPGSSVLADPGVPGADGHAAAFAFRGQLSAGTHLVEMLDTRTGDVAASHTTAGAVSFESFTAAKAIGLVETKQFDTTVYPPGDAAPYEVSDFLNSTSGVVADTADGTEAFVAAEQGLWAFGAPLPTDGSTLLHDARAFALGANAVQRVDLDGGKATDILGLAFDWRDYDLSLQQVGSGGFAADYYPHGVSTYQLTDDGSTTPDAAAKSATAKSSRASATGVTAPGTTAAPDQSRPTQAAPADASAGPLPGASLPIARTALPVQVKATLPAAAAQSDGAANAAETTRGYTPQQISARLGLKGDGTGQTVAIVDAYDYPTAEADLNHFAEHFGLPQTCGSADAGTDCFDFRTQFADGTRPDGNTGWNEEAALDIEWVHSVAPHAAIVLVESADASMGALERADDAAAALHPAAVSNSWGSSEFSEEGFYDRHCELADSVCVQSTGDAGYPSGYSSTNPYVLAVGGTNLQLDADGTTTGETAWSSTGGGLSYFEPRPAYQDGVQSSPLRATPDVSMVADPRTGVPVYVSMMQGGTLRSLWLEVGGTSLAAPIWAAVIGSADQLRAAAGKPHLASAGPDGDTAHADVYALGGNYLRDITSGSNGACGTECTAGPG
ncbi:PQQ-binding-like beta-propeller repeat protein, partial [Actinacidiphila rubida]|uniref:PQQ-binding-like beta-propeller repeat protein n=1 Tax=Actinacidiphila rubida TaxID=310780 RepID=UPI000849EA2B